MFHLPFRMHLTSLAALPMLRTHGRLHILAANPFFMAHVLRTVTWYGQLWLPESHSIYRIFLKGSGSLSILKEGAPLWALPDLDGRIAGAIAQQVSGVILVDLYEANLQNNRGSKYAWEAESQFMLAQVLNCPVPTLKVQLYIIASTAPLLWQAAVASGRKNGTCTRLCTPSGRHHSAA